MQPKALDLFQAYSQDKLPREGGYIISSFFSENSAYSKYEIVAYNGVKSLYLSEDGLTFQSDGNKLFVLVEPANYPRKHIEPFRRDSNEQIPHRFSELEIITARNQTKVMVSKEPIIAYSAFTILKPRGINFAFIFYNRPDVFDTIKFFFSKTLNKEARVPQNDAVKSSDAILKGLTKFNIWLS
ncbi:MAG: hypothetical protein GXP33_05625 [Spirochaetes bacterium]|nr:hypothetical protein [Spirochaetota bacterium]